MTEEKATKQSLIDRYNTISENPPSWWKKNSGDTPYHPERSRMEYEIARLLNAETGYANYWDKEDPHLLALYRDTFDWDLTYRIKAVWEITPPDCRQTITCESEEQFRQYLGGFLIPERPEDWTEYSSSFGDLEGIEDICASNLMKSDIP